ncbi:MAG: FAD-dependent oxidoreductase [Deltaproteobacteria bacterium]|nr:FAD-dependent oxidoreductase [Deltaproteobacteria bacterium]
MSQPTVAILGGGVAGMGVAYALARNGRAVTLLQSDPEVGGLAASFHRDGCSFPLGYHHILHRDRHLPFFLDRVSGENPAIAVGRIRPEHSKTCAKPQGGDPRGVRHEASQLPETGPASVHRPRSRSIREGGILAPGRFRADRWRPMRKRQGATRLETQGDHGEPVGIDCRSQLGVEAMKRTLAIGLSLLCLCATAEVAHACSTVFFEKNGETLIGHNMDWFADRLALVVNKRQVKKHGFVFPNDPEFTWTSKYGSISLVMEGREITGRGMNEAGLVIVEMALEGTQQSTDSDVPRLSVGQWAQYQLDTSATIEDVIASDKVVRQSPEEEWQSHFLLWDKTGAVALMEWLEGEMVVIKGDDISVPVFVNYRYDLCTAMGDDPTGRFKKMSDRYLAYDPAKDSDGFAFVTAVMQEGVDMFAPPVRTLWQFIFDPRAQRMSFTSFDNENLRFLDLEDFDFSCATQVEVFDMSSGDAGNVRSAFVPYTSKFNDELVDYIFGMYRSVGIPTSDDLIEKIKAFPESTPCMEGTGGSGGSSGSAGAGGSRTSSSGGAGGASSSSSSGTGGTQAQTSGAADGSTSSVGTGGTTSSAGTSTAGGSSSGCSCSLGDLRRARGLGAGLLGLGLVAWNWKRSCTPAVSRPR